jgi:NAD(P)-dependent dehydrogenase (short-subunit alcohol dehydrogenase family)
MRPGSSILITGASTGIGLALALHFARRKHRVYAGVRRARDADILTTRSGGRITPLLLDVTSAQDVEAAVGLVAQQTGGRLDALVNNAGIAFSGPLEMTPQADLQMLMDVNVMGTCAMTRACLPMLRAAKGRIVNISSISGVFAAPGLSAYVASKHAVEGLTAALRLELAPLGVKVCSVAPGKIDTPIWRKAKEVSSTMQHQYPPELQAVYRHITRFYEDYAQQERGTPLDALVGCVHRALHASSPRPRYIVGRSARLRALLNHLPDALRERLVLARFRA